MEGKRERKEERWGKGKERKKDGGKGKKGSKMGGNGMKEMGKRGKKDEGKWKERKKDGEKVKRKEEKGKKGPKTEAKRVKFIFFNKLSAALVGSFILRLTLATSVIYASNQLDIQKLSTRSKPIHQPDRRRFIFDFRKASKG